MMAVCNGLDVRALIYNDTALEQAGLSAPSTMEEFNSIIGTLSPPGRDRDRAFYTFLPDHRRLWAWGGVFGGAFVDADNSVELDHPGTVAALRWMQSFSRDYGSDNLAAFRTADQSLPGKAFPLLPISDDAVQGRYLFVMDGQWRIRDIERFNARREAEGKSEIEFGVCALPPPAGGREQAGWINGNFFVVPRGAKQKRGAWEFMKFWIGHDTPAEAAETCQAGGWIPVSPRVLSDPSFQEYLTVHPLFSKFIELAVSPNQIPIPIIPGAEKLKRELNQAVFGVMQDIDAEPEDALRQVATPSRIQKHQKGESP
jgi:multiple sugar transport system substrate-binding protein